MKRQRESVGEMTGLDVLKDLASTNTVNPPGNERAAAIRLKELLEPTGFLYRTRELRDRRANFITQLGREDDVELTFNGHLDVVSVMGHWDTNPFELCESGDREKTHRRGVCGMKGGVAVTCRTALAIAKAGGPERGMLKPLFVVDEEDINQGTRAYLQDIWDAGMGSGDGKSDPVYTVVGEPMNLEVAVVHRDMTKSYMGIRGAARHVALPKDGHSSIEKLPDMLHAILGVDQELEKRTHLVLPPPSISITMVDVCGKDNVVPGKIRLLADFRILPNMGYGEMEGILRNALCGAGTEHVEIRNHSFIPRGETSPDDEFVTRCYEIVGRVGNRTSKPQVLDVPYEQCFPMETDAKTMTLGPGSLEQARTRNEFSEVEQLERAAVIYEEIMWEMLGVAHLE